MDFLIKKGHTTDYGARPLRRAIERHIEDPLAEHILRSTFVDGIWDEEIVPEITEYIRIPCKSPLFDPDWAENGYMDQAIGQIEAWCRSRGIHCIQVGRRLSVGKLRRGRKLACWRRLVYDGI